MKDRLFLIAVFIIILLFRFKDITHFLYKENLITGYDAYYYARLSEEIFQNKDIDKLRNVPDFFGVEKPLIAYFGNFLSYLMPKEYVYAYTPPLLSVFFVIPLFFWIKRFSNIYLFIGSALIGGLNSIYFSRTYIGKYDTDSLILFFIFLILLFITISLEEIREREKAAFFSLLAGISYLTFQLWYSKPVFSWMFGFSFVAGFLAFYRHSLFNRRILINFFLSFSIFFLFLFIDFQPGIDEFLNLFKSYVQKADSIFPFLPVNIANFTKELQPVTLSQMIDFITSNPVIFFIACIGLVLALMRYFKYMIIALPIIAMGVISFKAGNRFIMYFAPFLGLGFGLIFYAITSFLKKKLPVKREIIRYTALSLLIFFSIPPNAPFIRVPTVLSDEVYNDFLSLRKLIRNDAFIWSWWDYGYAIEYLSRKGTYIDNGIIEIHKAYSIARSLITENPEESYRFVSFITNHKIPQYNDLSFKKFLNTVKNYKKPPEKDVYVLINKKALFYYGMYQIGMIGSGKNSFRLPAFKFFQECKKISAGRFHCSFITVKRRPLSFKTGINKKNSNIYRIVIKDGNRKISINWNKKGKLVAEVVLKGDKGYLILVDKDFANSIINKMFVLRDKFRHFTLVYDNFPFTVLYRVKR